MKHCEEVSEIGGLQYIIVRNTLTSVSEMGVWGRHPRHRGLGITIVLLGTSTHPSPSATSAPI